MPRLQNNAELIAKRETPAKIKISKNLTILHVNDARRSSTARNLHNDALIPLLLGLSGAKRTTRVSARPSGSSRVGHALP